MNDQQILILTVALNALGITAKPLEDVSPFKIVDLSKFEQKILPLNSMKNNMPKQSNKSQKDIGTRKTPVITAAFKKNEKTTTASLPVAPLKQKATHYGSRPKAALKKTI